MTHYDDPKKRALVSDLMTRDVESVGPEATIAYVREVFAERSLHHVLVVDGVHLIGLISVTDLLRAGVDPERASSARASDLRARHVMRERASIITAGEQTTILDAAAMLCDGDFHSLPIVGADDRLLGIVTSTDLITYLVELLESKR